MKRSLVALLALAGLTAVISSALDAAKPPPPPPPPPPAGPEVYVWRPDLGGMLDTSTNLVWGYEFYALSGGTAPYTFLQSQDYPTMMLNTADAFYDEADIHYSAGEIAEGDLYTDAAEACEDAATFTNWRFPTQAEAQNAMAKKLFKYDVPGFSGYLSTPLGPGMAYDGYTPCWTSTAAKKSRATYTPATGGTGAAPEGYSLDVIWVRKHTP